MNHRNSAVGWRSRGAQFNSKTLVNQFQIVKIEQKQKYGEPSTRLRKMAKIPKLISKRGNCKWRGGGVTTGG